MPAVTTHLQLLALIPPPPPPTTTPPPAHHLPSLYHIVGQYIGDYAREQRAPVKRTHISAQAAVTTLHTSGKISCLKGQCPHTSAAVPLFINQARLVV